MTHPRILDSVGNPLEVGSVVEVNRLDRARVTGFSHDFRGWRVEHSWLSGYHPGEPEPSEPTEPIDDTDSLRCPDLQLINPPTEEEKLDG